MSFARFVGTLPDLLIRRVGSLLRLVSRTEETHNTMSYTNLLEREQVCLCPRTISYLGQRGGYVVPTYHQDDCPFFEDDSRTESGNEIYLELNQPEYVF